MKTTRLGKINKVKPDWQFKIIVSVFLIACLTVFVSNVYTQTTIDRMVPTVHAQEKELTLPMKEYVLNEIRKAGIDEYNAYMIIHGESRWNPEATLVNKDRSIDRGLWQINNKYQPQVSNACAYDYVCATQEAIKIIKKQGFKPWVVANKLGIK